MFHSRQNVYRKEVFISVERLPVLSLVPENHFVVAILALDPGPHLDGGIGTQVKVYKVANASESSTIWLRIQQREEDGPLENLQQEHKNKELFELSFYIKLNSYLSSL
jgi:hypothetical protein